jgi:hypothetical protein
VECILLRYNYWVTYCTIDATYLYLLLHVFILFHYIEWTMYNNNSYSWYAVLKLHLKRWLSNSRNM